MNDNRGYGVKITVGGGAIKFKLIKLINSLFVHFITRVSDSTSRGGQSFRPRPQSDLPSLFLIIQYCLQVCLAKIEIASQVTAQSPKSVTFFFHLYFFLKDFDPIVNYRLPSLKSMRCAIVITSIAKKNIQRALSYESFGFEIALRLEQVENQSLHSSAATTSHFNSGV